MLRYILKRLLTFLPMLVVISLVAFVISVSSPGDPVERLLAGDQSMQNESQAVNMDRSSERIKLRHKLGLDLPVFYFSIATLADIDTIYKLIDPVQQESVQRLARHSGQPELSLQWFHQIQHTSTLLNQVQLDSSLMKNPIYADNLSRCKSLIRSISHSSETDEYTIRRDSLSMLLSITPGLTAIRSSWDKSLILHDQILETELNWKQWIPVVHWHGLQNQYHRWILGDGQERKGVIRGDFGLSFRDGQAISDRIVPRVKWSLTLSLLSMFLAFVISIPVGVRAGRYSGGWFDKITGFSLMGLYALPGFFVATGLLVLFSNPDFLDWFPSSGVKDINVFDPEWPFLKRLSHYLPYLVLPVISYTYASFAFISKQMSSGIHQQLQLDYIRTARAKGLSENSVVWKHAFRNALLPLITILGQALPMIFGGSVIIESIFSIPGMGQEIYESVLNYDYPMIVAIFTIFGFMTMLGYLIADILYAFVDPRIRYSTKN